MIQETINEKEPLPGADTPGLFGIKGFDFL
jgi:hypothetical protein